jgi:tetratricopeptide (TPR) repeat protein
MRSALSEEIFRIMEAELGEAGAYTLKKQCRELKLDPDDFPASELPRLVSVLANAATYFGQDKARAVYRRLAQLQSSTAEQPSEEPADLLEMHWNMGDASRHAGEPGDAITHYTKVIELAKGLGDLRRVARAYIQMGAIFLRSGNYEEASKLIKESHSVSRQIDDPRIIVDVGRALGNLHWRKGEYDKAVAILEDALAHARKNSYREGEAEVYLSLANICAERGDFKLCLEHYMQSLAILKELGNDELTVTVYNNIGVNFSKQGMYDKSVEFYERCIAISNKIGYVVMEGWALFNAAEDYAKLGQFEKALELCGKSQAIYSGLADDLGLSGVYFSYAIIYKLMKDYGRSLAYFGKTIEIREKLEMPYRLADAYTECGVMLVEKGDAALARENLEAALEIFVKLGNDKMAAKVGGILDGLKREP